MGMYPKGRAARSGRTFGRVLAMWRAGTLAQHGPAGRVSGRRSGHSCKIAARPSAWVIPPTCRRTPASPCTPVSRSPNELVATAVHAGRPGYEDCGVKLTTQLAAELPSLAADRDPAHAGARRSAFQCAAAHPAGWASHVSTEAAGPDVKITVADTGRGITAKHWPHIFERFYRADAARATGLMAGPGIGMTIARALVTAHGGTLTAASGGLGTGTRFTITCHLCRHLVARYVELPAPVPQVATSADGPIPEHRVQSRWPHKPVAWPTRPAASQISGPLPPRRGTQVLHSAGGAGDGNKAPAEAPAPEEG